MLMRTGIPVHWSERAIAKWILAALVMSFAMMFTTAATSSALSSDTTLASVVRGGRLYDTWYKEIGEPAPTARHQAYPADMAFADAPDINWRCAECHGWDYRGRDGAYAKGPHFTGIKGIRMMAGVKPAEIVAILKDARHGYGGLMADGDLADLALFVSRGQVDMDIYIDRESGAAKGGDLKPVEYYKTICANCHGMDGLNLRTMPPLADVVRTNPWKAMHMILNGHPGENMPALRVIGYPVLAEILAYLQNLPSEDLLASVVRGGRLYDNWYKEIKRKPPSIAHPAYPADMAFANQPGANWRCKECHGWDYLGRDGAYGAGKHFTGIKGIRAMEGAEPALVVELLDDDNHGYRTLLGRRDLRDLANFVSAGQVDMDRLIDRETAHALGDKDREAAYYQTICANCHGSDGRKIGTIPPLGALGVANPWEAMHKMLNGHPDEAMPALRVLDRQVLTDILAYVQSLPGER